MDALVSLNGRRAAPLIDPAVDLAQLDDGLAPAQWISPAPDGPPIRLRPARELLGQAGSMKTPKEHR